MYADIKLIETFNSLLLFDVCIYLLACKIYIFYVFSIYDIHWLIRLYFFCIVAISWYDKLFLARFAQTASIRKRAYFVANNFHGAQRMVNLSFLLIYVCLFFGNVVNFGINSFNVVSESTCVTFHFLCFSYVLALETASRRVNYM